MSKKSNYMHDRLIYFSLQFYYMGIEVTRTFSKVHYRITIKRNQYHTFYYRNPYRSLSTSKLFLNRSFNARAFLEYSINVAIKVFLHRNETKLPWFLAVDRTRSCRFQSESRGMDYSQLANTNSVNRVPDNSSIRVQFLCTRVYAALERHRRLFYPVCTARLEWRSAMQPVAHATH